MLATLGSILLLHTAPALADDKDGLLAAPVPYGQVQGWITVLDQDVDPVADPAGYGDPELDPGFSLRRARLGVKGEGDTLHYAVSVGVSSPYDALSASDSTSAQIVDAWMRVKATKGVFVHAGLLKVPIGREQLISSSQLSLSERAVQSEWLVPARDAGLVLDARVGDGTKVRARLGAFNGNGSFTGDDNSGKLLSARAELTHGPGRVYRTYGKVKGLTLGAAGDFWSDTDLSTKTVGYGGDLLLRVSGLAVLAEAHMATITPVNTDLETPGVLTETPRMGYLAQIGYSAGAFEPAVRYSVFDDDRDAEDNGDAAELLAGLTWHAKKDALRVGGGYVMRTETGGAAQANDSARLWGQVRF